jgi:hypothetical protein
MLRALCRADKGEIGSGVFFFFPLRHKFLAFFDEAHHSLAGLGPGRLAEEVKAFVQALNLRFCFREMLLEQFAELVEARSCCHLGKRLGQLLFGVDDIAQLVDQQFIQTGFPETVT